MKAMMIKHPRRRPSLPQGSGTAPPGGSIAGLVAAGPLGSQSTRAAGRNARGGAGAPGFASARANPLGGEANSAQAEGLSPQEIEEKVAEILRLCLDSHGGQFDPSAISHKTAGLTAEDERL